MPGKIPAQVGEKEFESQNQARKYYFEIMHSYPTGETLKVEDKQEVVELMKASSPERYQNTQIKEIKTHRGKFGKKCLQTSMDGAYFSPLSIVTAVRLCAKPMIVNHGVV